MKTFKFKFNILIMSIISIIIFIFTFYLYFLITKKDMFILSTSPLDIVYMILWLCIHEILHYLGFMLGKNVNKNNIILGIELEKGLMFCMCKDELNKKEILTSLLMPLVIIGFLTLIIGTLVNSSMLVFLSILNISGATGDILMTLFFIKMPKDIIYFDKEESNCFFLKSYNDLSKYKMIGIKLDETVNETKENNKKIRISKFSAVFLILALIYTIFLLIIK